MASASKIITRDIWNLRPGVFFDRHLLEIPEGGAADVSNVIQQRGYLRTRPGLFEDYDTGDTTPMYHLDNYVDFQNVRTIMRATRNPANGDVKLYRRNGSSWTLMATYAAAAPSPYTYTSSINFKGQWFFCAGSNGPLVSWNGTSLVDLRAAQSVAGKKAPQKPRLIAAHPDRIIVADVVDELGSRVPYRIAWCAILDPLTWRNSNSGDVGSGSAGYVDLADKSDPITALYASGDVILAFRPRAIYQGDYVGSPLTYKFRRLSEGAGCVAPGTLKEYRDGNLVWLGDDNIYMGGANQLPKPIGGPIEPFIRQNCDLTKMNFAVGEIDRDLHLYNLYLPNLQTGRNDLLVQCSLLENSWWKGVFAPELELDVTCSLGYRAANWDSDILLGAADGKIYNFDFNTYNDAGYPFDAWWTSGIFSSDRLAPGEEQASLQQLRSYATSGTIQLMAEVGDGIDRFVNYDFGNQVFDGVASLARDRRPYRGEHAKVTMKWTDKETQVCGLSIGFLIDKNKTRSRRD